MKYKFSSGKIFGENKKQKFEYIENKTNIPLLKSKCDA